MRLLRHEIMLVSVSFSPGGARHGFAPPTDPPVPER
jgi:hypothetical protein